MKSRIELEDPLHVRIVLLMYGSDCACQLGSLLSLGLGKRSSSSVSGKRLSLHQGWARKKGTIPLGFLREDRCDPSPCLVVHWLLSLNYPSGYLHESSCPRLEHSFLRLGHLSCTS